MAGSSRRLSTDVEPDDQPSASNDVQHMPDETSPLLPRRDSTTDDQTTPSKRSRWRWPSLIALLLLILGGILILVLVFIAPDVVKEYAEQAAVFEPESVSVDSFTSTGVRARIRGTFSLDSSRVREDHVRNLGRFFTSIVKEVESGESSVEVLLPEYGNIIIGTARVPPVVVSVESWLSSYIDILVELEPGNVDGLRTIANDWIDGRLGNLRVVGKAHVPLKSGIFSIGTQDIHHELVFSGDDVPKMPQYTLEHLDVREVDVPSKHDQAVIADAVLTVSNDYPVEFTIPPLAFNLLVDACKSSDPVIQAADAVTHEIIVRPEEPITVRVTAAMRQLPPSLVEDCPNSGKSPLDRLVGRYLKGNDSTVYVRGASRPPPIQNPEAPLAPPWISDLLASLIVPVPVPGHAFDDKLIRNFSLTDTHFGLPDPWAAPDSPESKPQISANVRALIALPEQVEFGLAVARVRATADVFYNGTKFGELDLHKWQAANSSRYDGPPPPPKPGQDPNDNSTLLLIQSQIDDAPLTITDEDGFTDVIQRLIFGQQAVMHISARIDVEVKTPIGPIVVRDVPAEGEIPVKRK